MIIFLPLIEKPQSCQTSDFDYQLFVFFVFNKTFSYICVGFTTHVTTSTHKGTS